MGRRVLALALAACVPIGALCAPLVHVHPDDHHDPHHQGSRVHAHVGGHGADHRQVRHADADHDHDADHDLITAEDRQHAPAIEEGAAPEEAVRFDYFVAVDAHAFVGAALQQDGYRLAPPFESAMRRPPVEVHSHGPPDSSPSGSRAPPAHLS